MKPRLALLLPHGRNNPRNSEGAFVALKNGQLAFAYSRYYGPRDWSDHATANICARLSDDHGNRWSEPDRVWVPNEGACNVMSVSLLRLRDGRIALFYLRKNGVDDCRLYLRTSRDEARTWSQAAGCLPLPGYFVVNNDRVIQLRGGRLVVPAAFHRNRKVPDSKSDYASVDFRGIAIFFLSDDGGRTWRESKDWWALPVRSGSGLQEPGVVELKGDRLYAYCRTDVGWQYEMFSEDGGETWTPPQPSAFKSPCSPLSIKRLPATGDLVAVWNDHRARWRMPKFKRSSWGRTPLVLAVSRNEGKTWERHQILERDPSRGFCYTAIYGLPDAILLAYCCGGRKSEVLQDLCIRRIGLDGLYRR